MTCVCAVFQCVQFLESEDKPTDQHERTSGNLHHVDIRPIAGSDCFKESFEVVHNERSTADNQTNASQLCVSCQHTQPTQEQAEVFHQKQRIVPIHTVVHHVADSGDNTRKPGNNQHGSRHLDIAKEQERRTEGFCETAYELGNIGEVGAVRHDVLNGFLHGVPCVQEQAKPRNFESNTACDVKSLHGGQPPQEVLHTLGDSPSKESRSNGKHTGKDFVNVFPYPIEEGLNFRHDLVNLFVHCVCNEVIGGKLKAKTAPAANAASTTGTATGILRGRDNIQLVNTEQCVFQLFCLFGSISQTVSRFTCAARYAADCVCPHVKLRNRDTEETGNNFSDHADCFRQSDCIRQDSFQNGKEQITQRTSGLFHLSLQNTKLVCRGFQCTSHIALCVCNLRHDCVVAQLGFFSLSHCRNAFLNAKVVCFLLQTSHRQVVTKPTKRLKLTGNTRLQLLESVRGADIEERSQIVGELGEVFAHGVSPVARNAEALSDCHKDTLIAHPLAGVDTHDFFDLLCVISGFLCILPHGHIEQVEVFDVAV